MITTKIDTKYFTKTMNNIVDYSFGFIDGVNRGKKIFLESLGKETIQVLKQYIDVNARLNQRALHHVYEWYQTGSPNARLYDFVYSVNGNGISFKSTFRQSTSVPRGSTVPFYNKAKIMEDGSPITIKPKKAQVLAFEVDGEEVFTKNPVVIDNPGGNVQGQFEKTVDAFFNRYFKQSFLRASGLFNYLENPTVFKKKIKAGAKIGRSVGVSTGMSWMANATVGEVE